LVKNYYASLGLWLPCHVTETDGSMFLRWCSNRIVLCLPKSEKHRINILRSVFSQRTMASFLPVWMSDSNKTLKEREIRLHACLVLLIDYIQKIYLCQWHRHGIRPTMHPHKEKLYEDTKNWFKMITVE